MPAVADLDGDGLLELAFLEADARNEEPGLIVRASVQSKDRQDIRDLGMSRVVKGARAGTYPGSDTARTM